MDQRKRICLGTMRLRVRSLTFLSGLRIRYCRELWCRSQMQIKSRVAMAVAKAGSHSSNWTPRLETSICHRCSPKKKKKNLLLEVLPYHPSQAVKVMVRKELKPPDGAQEGETQALNLLTELQNANGAEAAYQGPIFKC